MEYVDIGGSKLKPDARSPKYPWQILDVSGEPKYRVDLNGLEKFPIADGAIDAYYLSMVLEHIEIDKLAFVLSEVYRTLNPKGVIRVIVPNITLALRTFANKPKDIRKWGNLMTRPDFYPDTDLGFLIPWMITVPNEKMRETKRSGHQNMFDDETLTWWLSKSGFRNITKSSYNKGSECFTGKDSGYYKDIAIFMEATK